MSESGSFPTVGHIVPDYELLQRIGGGGYGEVWLARSKATGVLRAAKLIWRRKFNDDRPFEREFDGIRRFERISTEHPRLLAIFHVGRNDPEGYFYYVMELADNLGTGTNYKPHTLRADLESGRLPAAAVLQLGLSLVEALGHLHHHGLVHRDIKPSNVIFINGQPKLADIGLVTDASDECSIVGTEGYLSPEGPGTPQADVFALGKALYEASTGMDRREFPKLPKEMRDWPDVRQVFELNEVFLKACAADPRQRYATAETMLAELALLHGGKSLKRKRTRQWCWMLGKRASLGAAVFAALAIAVTILVHGTNRADPYPDGPASTNLVANADCDKGMAIIREDNYGQLAQAYAYFTNAINLDPHFARPYVGLLEMALRDQGTVLMLPTAARTIRQEATGRLKQLAPGLGATFVAQSINSYYNLDFPAAERYALQGIKANPKYELGHTWYGFMLSHWRRPVEARAQLDISTTLAPSKAIVYRCIGHVYFAQRDFTNAIVWYQKAIALDAHHQEDFYWLGRTQRAVGDYDASIETQEKGDLLYATNEAAVKQRYEGLRHAITSGPRGFWEQVRKNSPPNSRDFYPKAVIQIQLGDTNAALKLLGTASASQQDRDNEGGLHNLLFDEYWDSLRDNGRFKALLDKIGYTKVMPARNERP